jgi:hypothetical protein
VRDIRLSERAERQASILPAIPNVDRAQPGALRPGLAGWAPSSSPRR